MAKGIKMYDEYIKRVNELLSQIGGDIMSIWKYIPKKAYKYIDDAFVDSDGYWVYLNKDSVAYDGGEDCRIIHVETIKELKEDLKTIRLREEVK